MHLKTILLGFFLCFNIAFCQEQNDSLLQLEKQADSIYFNFSEYSSKTDIVHGLNLYDDALKLNRNPETLAYNRIISKKLAIKALLMEMEMQYDSAVVYSKKSIKLQENLKHSNKLFNGHTHKGLYRQWTELREYDSVIATARLAKQIFTDTLGENHKLIAEALFDIGRAYGWKDQRDKNMEYYKKAIAMNIAYKGEFTPEAAIQEHHLALVYGFIGFYKKELESYKNVVRRWEAIPDYKDMSYLGIAYGSLNTWYLQHGDIKTAEQYIIKKEALVKNSKKDIKNWFNETFKGRTQLHLWYSQANLAFQKEDTILATFYNDKILKFVTNFDKNDPRNNPHNLSYFMNFVDLNHMAALRLKGRMINNKESEEYLALNENIIKIAGLEGGPTATLGEKLNIIDYYLTKKEYETAGKKLKSWISYANTRKSDYSLMLLHTKQANLVIAEKRFDTLDVIYNSVFRKIQRDSLQHIQIEVLNHKDCKPYGNRSIVKMFLDATKNYSKAYGATSKEAYLDKAHNLSTLASGVFSENFSYLPFNEGTYKTATQINEQLLNTAVLLKDNVAIDKVLQSIEQNGSKLSWKKFLASSQRENLNIPDSIIEKESELKSELQFYKKALFADTDINKEKANRFKEKIHNVETEIEQLEKWYSNNYPSYFNQTQKAFDIQLLKQKLKPNQSVIKYVFAEDNVYAFAVSKDATNLIKLASRKELVRKLKPFVLALNKTNSQDFQDLAKEIYSLLLPQSLLIADKKQQLIFIQDDVLNYVPMEVLVDANGKYLIQSHAVSYAASLLLWNEQLQVKKSRRNKMGVFVPSYKNQKNDNPKRDDDTELLGANTEANAIGKLFRSDVFSGPEVSKAQFLNTAKNYNILHLAMHSAINDTDAEFSNLRFSSDKDSKLFISELYNMNLNADLAVLSACNTGAGSLKNGEGLINVSRAFTYAGVPSTVTSLWKVPDQETSKIMISFYKYLKSGKQKNEALQLAKLDYLKNTNDAELKHPFYWAGFVVSGDIEPITNSNRKWPYAISSIFLIGFVFRKRLFQLFN